MPEAQLYRCPRCGRTDAIVITAEIEVLLVQESADEFHTKVWDEEGQEWHDDSPARCRECRYSGSLSSFDPE
jgi:DNA-directed RNA polymerase subunit RPC12/RpoP